MKMSDFERIRLVILGGAGVGKSCIIKRFLFKTYSDKYRPTVEDLYNREYDLGAVTLKVSIYLPPLHILKPRPGQRLPGQYVLKKYELGSFILALVFFHSDYNFFSAKLGV